MRKVVPSRTEQSVVDEPVPDGVPCPENVIRGQVMC